METNWRIEDLKFAVELALEAAEYDGQTSARIRSVPDTRVIRYYTTLGILDRAAEMKGRTAFYDRRHVLQLVSIKRLQAEGLKLGEIQQKLTGLSNRKLSGIANLPTDYWDLLQRRFAKRAKQSTKATAFKKKSSKTPNETLQHDVASTKAELIDGVAATSAMELHRSVQSDESQPKIRTRSKKKTKPSTMREQPRSAGEFWAAPTIAATEHDSTNDSLAQRDAEQTASQIDASQMIVRNETRIEFPGGIAISIPIPTHEVTPEIIEELLPSLKELASKIESIQQWQTQRPTDET